MGGSLVVALGIVLPLFLAGTVLGHELAFADDVGASGGAFACLGAWMGRLPSWWSGLPLWRLMLAGVAVFFLADLFAPAALEADLLHLIVFPLGLALDRRLTAYSRCPLFPTPRRTRRTGPVGSARLC